jgi:hypothetical protein
VLLVVSINVGVRRKILRWCRRRLNRRRRRRLDRHRSEG